MPRYRKALRRTQAQADAERRTNKAIDTLTRAQLQELAKEQGIDARQSSDALREQLSND